MQLLSKYNKGIRFLLCVIDIFSIQNIIKENLLLLKDLLER